MSKERPRSVRLWPLVCVSAALWLAWALSASFPLTLRAGSQVYLSLQRGCIGAWFWSPADRPSLGLHDTLSLSTNPVGSMHCTPFAWFDAWGFGLGTPLYIPALILTFVVARRYAVTTVRDAPPPTRRARRWAVVWIFLWSVPTLCLLLSARHHLEDVFTCGNKQVTIENGSLVLGRSEQSLAPPPVSLASSRLFITTTGTVSGFVPPSRQGVLWFDLIPDLDTSTPLWRFALPLWPFVVGLGWMAWKAQRAAAYQGKGLCPACGYDLSGLASGSTCPECGVRPRAGLTAPNNTPSTEPPPA